MNLIHRFVQRRNFPFSSITTFHKRFLSDKSSYDELLYEDSDYLALSENHLKFEAAKKCFIIQPYVKWGPQKLKDITPNEQLEEAQSLINTLPSWIVEDKIVVPLESLDKKTLFGSGSLEKLRQQLLRSATVNAVFINLGTLKKAQMLNLEKEFRLPVLDRYRVIMQILKLHAVSKHAKIQVALAELYYLQKSIFQDASFGKVEREKMKMMFQTREQKLKTAIKQLRLERGLLRNKREKNDYPVVAVVGYTNAGKTSLIKALTGQDKLKPKNQLFATLDVTMHEGLLPSGLKVLYVDTVGFISDVPTNLIECFVATLEDAMLADVILHVEDLASTCYEFKRKHVFSVLNNLATKTATSDIINKIINVGNKCDLLSEPSEYSEILKVSSKEETGLDTLRYELEKNILRNTDRKKLKVRVPTGSEAMRWLYKNAAVITETPDQKNTEFVVASIIITHAKLEQFKHYFTPP